MKKKRWIIKQWVYARDEEDAQERAEGKDGYGSWNSEKAAIMKGPKI